MGVIHSNHCVYDAHYHLVFPIKYRKALLEPHISTAILGIAKEIEERYDITFEKIGTDGNHIHILCSFHPKILRLANRGNVQKHHRSRIVQAIS